MQTQSQLYAKEFYPAKKGGILKLAPFTLFSLFLWGVCILFVDEFIIHNPLNDAVDFIICFMGLFLGLTTLWFTYYVVYKILFYYKLRLHKQPLVTISDKGISIYDIVTGKKDCIGWKDIQFFLPYGFSNKPYAISIAVNDPKLFITKEKSVLKKQALKRSIKKYKAPFVIFPGRLDTTEDIYKLLNDYLQKSRVLVS